jgi:hypothetical protein
MSERVETVPASIEHLDWAVPCAVAGQPCTPRNPAAYLVVHRACGGVTPICNECVAWRIAAGDNLWRWTCCLISRGHWLDLVTLHPLGGTP